LKPPLDRSGGGRKGVTRVGEPLKSRNPNFKVLAVEPENSPGIGGGSPGPHKIQGIGAGFIPSNLNTAIVDEAITVTNEEAFEMAQKLAQLESIPAGISTGANVASALKVAARDEFQGKRIVTIGCSSTERYLSTPLAETYREKVTNLPAADLLE
jgi:cysteine synthase A